MNESSPNSHVVHPKTLLKREQRGIRRFNTTLAVAITNSVGSMWSAYIFGILSLTSLPAILVELDPSMRQFFPHWIINVSLITLIAWISQNFLQLVLLPIIMVGQNVIQDHQSAKANADHHTLTYLTNLQEQQMTELRNQAAAIEAIHQKLGIERTEQQAAVGPQLQALNERQ